MAVVSIFQKLLFFSKLSYGRILVIRRTGHIKFITQYERVNCGQLRKRTAKTIEKSRAVCPNIREYAYIFILLFDSLDKGV